METIDRPTSRDRRQRIGRRLIALVIAFSSCIAAVTTAVQLVVEYGRQEKEVINALDAVNLYLPNMAASVWNVDVPLIETTVLALGHIPAVESVTVRGRSTDFLSGLEWSYGSRQSRSTIKRTYTLQHAQNGKDTAIADLEIEASVDAIYKHIAQQAVTILVTNAIKTFIVAAFMLMLVRRLITARIEDLAARLEGVTREIVTTDDVNEREPTVQGRQAGSDPHAFAAAQGGDEIDHLCRDFDFLVGRLRDYSQRMESKVQQRTAQLATLNAELARSNQAFGLSAEALKESQGYLRQIVDGSSIPIFVIDREHRVTHWNRACEEFTGVTAGQIVGTSDHWRPFYSAKRPLMADLIVDEAPAEVVDRYYEGKYQPSALISGSFEVEDIFPQLGKDGKWLFFTAAPLRDATGTVIGAIETLQDLTERKRAEQRAEEASRAKSQFLADMSHEIRTPMNVIVGFTESLCQEVQIESERNKLAKIDQAANHLLGIINNILDLSKIEAGKLSVNTEDFLLRALLFGVQGQFLAQAREKNLDLRLVVDADVPDRLNGDPLRIRQCLFNYVSNAVKFTPNGAVMIRISMEKQTDAGFLVRFQVDDSGIGIEPQVLTRLFTPFEQADTSTTRQFGGTGLGLVLTKKLATLMGGGAGVESIAGRGSRFWFTALLQPALTDGVENEDAKGSSVMPVESFAGVHILVAEDVDANRELLRHMLKKINCDTDTAINGQVALEMATAAPYDLILMDMRMPVMDGLSATKAIRQLSGYADTPIIALTANAFEEDRQLCLDAGMSDFLRKPLRFDTLLAALSKWLARPDH